MARVSAVPQAPVQGHDKGQPSPDADVHMCEWPDVIRPFSSQPNCSQTLRQIQLDDGVQCDVQRRLQQRLPQIIPDVLVPAGSTWFKQHGKSITIQPAGNETVVKSVGATPSARCEGR
jgi:hypothetical protein